MDGNGKLTVLDPHGQPSGIFGRRLDAESNPRAILDPFEQPSGEIKPMSMASRLASLDGETVYLVETGFGGSSEFMEEMQDWFSKNMPTVKIVIRHKRGTMFTDDPELWTEIKSSGGSAAILGVGG
ncbi:MAG TPA: hypothetical protein VMD77_14880 [Candidatus Baltobacteraceae bacterium]|nr:hypothetical protein [Candidatus Baltobacteraceae bacterium]